MVISSRRISHYFLETYLKAPSSNSSSRHFDPFFLIKVGSESVALQRKYWGSNLIMVDLDQ